MKNSGPKRDAVDVRGRPFGRTAGVIGAGSVDLDLLDIDLRDVTDMLPILLAMGVFCGAPAIEVRFFAKTDRGVPFINAGASSVDFRAALPFSSSIDNSSTMVSNSSCIGETVPTIRRLCSIERTRSPWSGLSSSCSSASAIDRAWEEPRFRLPNCGVTVRSLGVFFRIGPLRWTDALRRLCVDPFAARGVSRTGVRRDDR